MRYIKRVAEKNGEERGEVTTIEREGERSLAEGESVEKEGVWEMKEGKCEMLIRVYIGSASP